MNKLPTDYRLPLTDYRPPPTSFPIQLAFNSFDESMPTRFVFVFFALLLLPGKALPQDSLRILTWNIQMLPNFVKSNGKAKRAKAIVEQLQTQSYDVVIFEEVFKKRSRRIITNGLSDSFRYHTAILNKKFIALKTNGGVMIFSKHPIDSVHQIRYKERTGFDRLSRKGALMAELNFNGKNVQVIGTHLQAFGPADIMHSQYQQLHEELLKPHTKAGVPQFICGDFNTIKNIASVLPDGITQDQVDRLPRFQYMLKTLDAVDGDLEGSQQFTMDRPFNDLCKTRKDFRLLLDYVLIRNHDNLQLTVSRRVRIMRQSWHKDHQDLSDHFGVEASISGF